MYNYSGIIYRIWGVGGIIAAMGLILLISSFLVRVDELQKRFFIVAVLFVVLGVGSAFEYSAALRDPEILVFEGTFVEEYRNSRAAPPLPLTWQYTFRNENGERNTFYLDVMSKKDIFSDTFNNSIRYRIYYEAEHKIIVKIELLGS